MCFYLQSFIIEDKVFYELVSEKGSIFNLVKEIDNDDLSFIDQYKDKKYNDLVQKFSEYLQKYCKLNRKKLNQDIIDISYVLVLILLVLKCEQHTEKYSYKDLRSKVAQFINYLYIDLEDLFFEDWFRISLPIQEYILTDNDYNTIQKRKDISFMTYTNFGYIDYTKNLILSLEKCNFPLQLIVYCVDQKSYDILREFNEYIILKLLLDEDNQNENFVKLYKEGWDKMMISKLKAIRKELYLSDYVFYTDSDIVFENNFCIQYLLDNLYDNDMLLQNNYNHEFCAGFMFIKSNDVTRGIFETKNIDMEKFICDQPYLNSQRGKMKYKVLPLELFPVGGFYYKYHQTMKPFIIHFNWMTGNDKITKMHAYHKWHIGQNKSIMYKDFTTKITNDSITLFCVLRDELILLEYFIKYYESIGVTHFVFIDNNSIDGSFEYLQDKNNTNMMLYRNKGSYKSSNLGVMWVEELMLKYCKDKWCLTVDIDELLHIQENNLNELRHKMIDKGSNVLLTMLLDMYSLKDPQYKQGGDFLESCPYHDVFNSAHYNIRGRISNLDNDTRIVGGVRKRLFSMGAYLTKRNFYKYDFYDKFYIDVGYHALLNRNINDNDEYIHYYPIINMNLHFKFIKSDIKKVFDSRIENNNLLNEDKFSHNNFEGWNKQILTYSKLWNDYGQFYKENYTLKYDKDTIYNYFWYMYTGIKDIK